MNLSQVAINRNLLSAINTKCRIFHKRQNTRDPRSYQWQKVTILSNFVCFLTFRPSSMAGQQVCFFKQTFRTAVPFLFLYRKKWKKQPKFFKFFLLLHFSYFLHNCSQRLVSFATTISCATPSRMPCNKAKDSPFKTF